MILNNIVFCIAIAISLRGSISNCATLYVTTPEPSQYLNTVNPTTAELSQIGPELLLGPQSNSVIDYDGIYYKAGKTFRPTGLVGFSISTFNVTTNVDIDYTYNSPVWMALYPTGELILFGVQYSNVYVMIRFNPKTNTGQQIGGVDFGSHRITNTNAYAYYPEKDIIFTAATGNFIFGINVNTAQMVYNFSTTPITVMSLHYDLNTGLMYGIGCDSELFLVVSFNPRTLAITVVSKLSIPSDQYGVISSYDPYSNTLVAYFDRKIYISFDIKTKKQTSNVVIGYYPYGVIFA